jgi:hypothetical protein
MFAALAVAATLTLNVHVAPGVPAPIVPDALEEAAAIWRGAGLTLHWVVDPAEPGCSLSVVIENTAPGGSHRMLPLGWINFEADQPTEEIHLSFNNAVTLLEDVKGADEAFRLTTAERNAMLSRALGRALAHELGHYLLGSREHTRRGLMQTARPATDFFERGNGRFAIAPSQERIVASRWPKFLMAATNH